MKETHFIYADLSTYNLQTATRFYQNVFGWEYHHSGDGYHLAYLGNQEVSGLYETPQKFKDMNMPSFWMSYIQVNDVERTVAKAKELGGIIEVVETNAAIGKIALVRDPLGAGFTIYEGEKLNSRTKDGINMLVDNQLFISDIKKVKPFYEAIFNWDIQDAGGGVFEIKDTKKHTIGSINEVSNDIKGKYEYWSVFFGVKSIAETKKRVLENGGSVVFDNDETTLLADEFGAFFHLVELGTKSESTSNKSIKWKALAGLGLIFLTLFTGWNWIWGIFSLIWIGSDLKSGATHLFELVTRKQNPLLYWAIVGIWIFFGIYNLTAPFFPNMWGITNSSYTYADSSYTTNNYHPINHVAKEYINSSKKAQNQVSTQQKDTLNYQKVYQKKRYFVGISAELTGNTSSDEQIVNELWKYFSENDISSVIPNITANKVGLIYSQYQSKGDFFQKVLLGYPVNHVGKIYEGLQSVTVPASQFAYFQSPDNTTDFIEQTWNKIAGSQLQLNGKQVLELYTVNNENKFTKMEIQVGL